MKLDNIIERILNTGRMLETGVLWEEGATKDIHALLREYDALKNMESSSRIISESDCPEIITPKEVIEERQRGITITKAQTERTAVCVQCQKKLTDNKILFCSQECGGEYLVPKQTER